MQLLDQIIDGATGNIEPLSNLLRKCLVLASVLKNEKLKAWAHNELNGYDNPDTLPPYRTVRIIAQGLFLGSFGRLIDDQPLPPGAMKEEHRDWARMANLTQPIAAYDGFDKKEGRVQYRGLLALLLVIKQNSSQTKILSLIEHGRIYPHQQSLLCWTPSEIAFSASRSNYENNSAASRTKPRN
jgi:hypothetical protein